jgi:hypothetical protein
MPNFRLAAGDVSAQGQRPDTGVHHQHHVRRERSAL